MILSAKKFLEMLLLPQIVSNLLWCWRTLWFRITNLWSRFFTKFDPFIMFCSKYKKNIKLLRHLLLRKTPGQPKCLQPLSSFYRIKIHFEISPILKFFIEKFKDQRMGMTPVNKQKRNGHPCCLQKRPLSNGYTDTKIKLPWTMISKALYFRLEP